MPETLATFADIKATVLSLTGQYGIDFDSNDDDALEGIVKQVLDMYSSYLPYTEEDTIYVAAGGYDLNDPAPDMMFSCELLIYRGYIPDALGWAFRTGGARSIGVPDKSWEYRKPTLYVPVSGDYEIRMGWRYYLDVDGNVQPEAVPHHLFLDLVVGYYLVSLGRRRRMVRFGDVSIDLDGDQLVSEGQNLIDTTIEALKEASSIWNTL